MRVTSVSCHRIGHLLANSHTGLLCVKRVLLCSTLTGHGRQLPPLESCGWPFGLNPLFKWTVGWAGLAHRPDSAC